MKKRGFTHIKHTVELRVNIGNRPNKEMKGKKMELCHDYWEDGWVAQ